MLKPPEQFSSCHPGPGHALFGPRPPPGPAPPRPAASVFLPGRAGPGSPRQQRGILGAASGCPRRRLGAKPCARPSRTLQGTALSSSFPPSSRSPSLLGRGRGRARATPGSAGRRPLGPRMFMSAVLRGCCAGWDGTWVPPPPPAALLGLATAGRAADSGPAGRTAPIDSAHAGP